MEQTRRWKIEGELGHPQLVLFDRVRMLLVHSQLPPLPAVYDLLWRYVTDRDHALSHAVDVAFSQGALDLAAVRELRRQHGGDG